MLSVLSEIRETEACGGLILPLLPHAYHHEHDDGDNIRCHLQQLLGFECEVRDIVVDDEKSAEKYRAEYADIRAPHGEYDKGDGEPASVAESVV